MFSRTSILSVNHHESIVFCYQSDTCGIARRGWGWGVQGGGKVPLNNNNKIFEIGKKRREKKEWEKIRKINNQKQKAAGFSFALVTDL